MTWDEKRYYETGISKGVLYPYDPLSSSYTNGVPWSGLSSVSESPSGAEANPIYADNIKYLNLYSVEEFACTIEAYTYPDEFALCDGSAELAPGVLIGQQDRKSFGLSYRTNLGENAEGNTYGYKLHLVYGCTASPSEKQYSTINDSPEAIAFSWEINTTPVNVNAAGVQPTSIIIIDSTKADKAKLEALEDILYGKGDTPARLPLPDEIKTIMSA